MKLIELQLIYYWRSSSNSRRMLSLSWVAWATRSRAVTAFEYNTHTSRSVHKLQIVQYYVVTETASSSFLPLRCEFSCDDLQQESFGKSRETFFQTSKMIQYFLHVIHMIRDVQDTIQYKHPLFIVSDEGISHASCVPSKITPYSLYKTIRSETQYIKISTLCNSDTLSEVRYRPDKGWSRVLIVRNHRSNVELTSIWFLFGILDMIRKIFQTMKLPKFDLLDTICNVYLDTFVISM